MDNEKLDLADELCNVDDVELAMAIAEAMKLLPMLHQAWSINQAGRLERVYLLKSFKESVALAQKIGDVAEAAEHYPDLLISYGKVRAELWTHKVSGLSRADFVLAAKFDRALGAKENYV